MNTEPIICSGDDLASVLAGIREKGGVVTDLVAGVGGNAGYKVNYFERVTELADVSVVGSDHSRKWPSQAVAGSTPAALNPFPFACGDCDPCLGGRPDQCAIFPTKKVPHQGETPDNNLPVPVLAPEKRVAEKCVTEVDNRKDSHNGSLGSIQSCVTDTLAAGKTPSIETRLEALQSRLAATGKLRRNKSREARMPYCDA